MATVPIIDEFGCYSTDIHAAVPHMDPVIFVLHQWSWRMALSVLPSITFLKFQCICRQTTDRIELKFGVWTHYRTSTEFQLFPGLWLNSFCLFADKLLIKSSSYLVGELIMGLPRTDSLLVMFCWIPVFSWPVIGQIISMHLQTNCWSDQAPNLVGELIMGLSRPH